MVAGTAEATWALAKCAGVDFGDIGSALDSEEAAGLFALALDFLWIT